MSVTTAPHQKPPDDKEKNGPDKPAVPVKPEAVPEVQRELRKFVRRLLETEFDMREGARISKDTRNELTSVLVTEDVNKLPSKLKAHHISAITDKIVNSPIGLVPPRFTETESKKLNRLIKLIKLIKNYFFGRSIRKIKPAEASITYYPKGGASEEAKKLEELVSDPHSEEAKAVAWLFKYGIDPDPAKRQEASKAFNRIENETELKDAAVLMKMRATLKKLEDDHGNAKLGEEGAITGATIASGKGRIGRQQQLALMYQGSANSQATTPNGNPAPYQEKAAKAEEEMEKLLEKQHALVMALENVDQMSQELSTKPPLIPGLEDIAKDFSVKAIASRYTSDIEIGGEKKQVSEWLTSDQVQAKVNALVELHRHSGTGLPRSSVVLDKLLKIYIGPTIYGKSADEQKEIFGEIKARLLAGRQPVAAPTETPNPLMKGAKATWRFLWGGSSEPKAAASEHGHGNSAAHGGRKRGFIQKFFFGDPNAPAPKPDPVVTFLKWFFIGKGGGGSGSPH